MAFWKGKPSPAKRPAQPAQKPRAQAGGGLNVPKGEIQSVLAECAEYQIPAVIISPDSNAIAQARFAQADQQTVSFDVLQHMGDQAKALATACVSYFREGRAFIFITTVRTFKVLDATGLPRMTLELPEQITGTDVRKAFRVPVLPDANLKITLVTSDRAQHQPRALDVSYGGMLVVFEGGEVPEFVVGQQVKVQISLEGQVLAIDGEVRRRMGDLRNKYGLLFPDCVVADGFKAPEPYRRVVVAIEKAWLQHRRK